MEGLGALAGELDLPRLALSAVALTAAWYALGAVQAVAEWWHRAALHARLPPGPPAASWLGGSFAVLAQKDHHRVHEAWANQYGGVVPYRALHRHVRPHL